MSTWQNAPTATLKVRKSGSTETFSFPGVSDDASAGTPENFLDAANHLLDFAGLSAVKDGMIRVVTQGVSE